MNVKNVFNAASRPQFGIQARGGCACAGPYAQRLLGMSQRDAKAFSELLQGSILQSSLWAETFRMNFRPQI
jgi:hypothetical protein